MKNQKCLTLALEPQAKAAFLKAALKGLNGRTFGATNIKADKSVREWKGCKLSSALNQGNPTMANVVENNNQSAPRNINLLTVTEFRADGQVIKFA